MTFAVGVVAHISRWEMAEHLADAIDADHVSFDDGSLGCTANHLRVWGKQADTDWTVVIEDDAKPCDGFPGQLEQILRIAPTSIVGLYLGRSYPPAWQDSIRHIANRPEHWAISSHLLHGVGTAIRTPLVPGMIAHVQALHDVPIDAAITDWARHNRHLVGYARPSILDHRDEPPVITRRNDSGSRDEPRTAWAFGTRDHWNRSQVTL